MDKKQFRDLQTIINYAIEQVKSSAGDIQVLDYTSGQDQVHDMEVLLSNLEFDHELYMVQEFMKDLDIEMKLAEFDSISHKIFEDEKWTIEFRGHKVTVGNCAAIYNGIHDMLNDFVKEYTGK